MGQFKAADTTKYFFCSSSDHNVYGSFQLQSPRNDWNELLPRLSTIQRRTSTEASMVSRHGCSTDFMVLKVQGHGTSWISWRVTIYWFILIENMTPWGELHMLARCYVTKSHSYKNNYRSECVANAHTKVIIFCKSILVIAIKRSSSWVFNWVLHDLSNSLSQLFLFKIFE